VDDRGSIPGRGRDFSVRHGVQTSSGAHPISCLMGAGVTFPGRKAAGRETDHSSSAEIKNVWSYASIPT
jgi:hypothetical protein